ncbi:MAG: helix-turn-helix domain-containing protein [Armatimonadota bacterium]
MADYDNKLGKWFKDIDKMAEDFKARKKSPDSEAIEKPAAPKIERRQGSSEVKSVVAETPLMQATVSSVATIDTSEVVAETGTPKPIIDAPRNDVSQAREFNSSQSLFDEAELPPVEDFFSFLSRTGEPEVKPEIKTEIKPDIEPEVKFEVKPEVRPEPKAASIDEIIHEEPPVVQPLANLSEGTGDPKPITVTPKTEPAAEVKFEAKPIEKMPEAPVQQIVPEVTTETEPALQEKWDRMPHHLQTLFGAAGEEVAQNSYKAFRETRGELIQRLLDPPLTLEEAARILNVCPTTVRRYTNRGVLQHFRTAGNQRRFRLSDVLTFMESNPKVSVSES